MADQNPALPQEKLTSSASLTLGDHINFGESTSHYQTVGLGGNVVYQASTYSNVIGGAALAWTASGTGQSSTRAKVNFKYIHSRAFNVKSLRYTLALDLSKSQSKQQRLTNNARDGYLLDQKLQYEIGRLYLRLNATVSQYTKSKHSLIVFQLGRSFGSI